MPTDSSQIRNVNWIFVFAVTAILLLAVWEIRNILLLGVAAILLTVFATMPVRLLMRWGVGRGLAIVLSLLGGIVTLIVMFALVFPTLFTQFQVLFTDVVPRGVERAIEAWNSGETYEQFPFLEEVLHDFEINNEVINQVVGQVSNALSRLGGSVLPLIGGVASAVLSTLIILFLCMYFIAEPDRYIRGVIGLTPIWYRERAHEIMMRLDETARSWVRITGASMLITGLGTAVGLALIGIQQWAALGVLSGVLSFIPNFGPIMALIPSVAVAIVQAPEYIFLVVVIIYGVSFIQSQLVGPILANEGMNLAPVLILIGQIVFGVFFGFLGIMLAVPLTAICVVLVQEIYVKDILGDGAQEPFDVPLDESQVEPAAD